MNNFLSNVILRTSRKLFIEKLKSVQYDLQNILDGVTKEGTYG